MNLQRKLELIFVFLFEIEDVLRSLEWFQETVKTV